MKILHEILGILLAAILAAIAVSILGPALSAGRWDAFCEPCQWDRMAVAVAAAGCLVLVFVYAVSGLCGTAGGRYHTLWRDGGRISIGLGVIAAQVLKLEDEFPPVVKMQSSVRSRGSSIDVVLDVRVVEGTDVNELGESLQRRVRERLAETLGLSDIRRVDVRVRHVQAAAIRAGN